MRIAHIIKLPFQFEFWNFKYSKNWLKYNVHFKPEKIVLKNSLTAPLIMWKLTRHVLFFKRKTFPVVLSLLFCLVHSIVLLIMSHWIEIRSILSTFLKHLVVVDISVVEPSTGLRDFRLERNFFVTFPFLFLLLLHYFFLKNHYIIIQIVI